MMKRLLVLVSVLMLLVVISGCSSEPKTPVEAPAKTPAVTPVATPEVTPVETPEVELVETPEVETSEEDLASQPVAANTVEVTNGVANPASISVTVGDKVTFVDKDGKWHNFAYRDASGRTKQSGKFTGVNKGMLTFDTAGNYEVKDVHSNALVSVTVQ